jgi:hypothetical protein
MTAGGCRFTVGKRAARVGGGVDALTCVAIELQLSRDPDRCVWRGASPDAAYPSILPQNAVEHVR